MPALAAPSRPRSKRKYIVTSLYGRIQEFLKKNYTYEKICELIESVTGIFFKVTTLRKYLYLEKVRLSGGKLLRGARTRATSERKGRTKSNANARTSSIPEAPAPEHPEAEPSSAVAPITPAQKSATQPKSNPKATPAQAEVEQLPTGESSGSETVSADLGQTQVQDSGDPEEQSVTPQAASPKQDDQNPPAGGLLNEPKFNTMERD